MKINKLFFKVLYFLIHCNFIIGFLFRALKLKFRYKGQIFNVSNLNLPTKFYSAFFFKTYEINDRIVLEKFLNKKNHCIIIGAGIGFIPSLVYKLTNNKVFCFEIDQKLKNIIKENLNSNKIKYKLIMKNLSFKKKTKRFKYYSNDNFLANTYKRYNKKKNINEKVKFDNINIVSNIFYQDCNIKKFNTFVIDAEGYELEIIKNLNKLKNIDHLFFELHDDILNKKNINKIFSKLKKQKFIKIHSFLNSYYFRKISV
tara:strand:- start:46 stop:816 length:771 start_codon:yes stop_codon:yes gene_type:complete